MKRCIILAGGPPEDYAGTAVAPGEADLVVACDAGCAAAVRLGLKVQLAVGDFDSYRGELPKGAEIHRVKPEKNETDTMLGVRLGLQRGYREFLILGGFGGRLDHTVANLQTLHYLARRGARGEILSDRNRAWVVENGELRLQRPEDFWYLSVFAWGGACKGVNLRGVKYPLEGAQLRGSFPLGVSNEFQQAQAVIQVERGALLVLASKG